MTLYLGGMLGDFNEPFVLSSNNGANYQDPSIFSSYGFQAATGATEFYVAFTFTDSYYQLEDLYYYDLGELQNGVAVFSDAVKIEYKDLNDQW